MPNPDHVPTATIELDRPRRIAVTETVIRLTRDLLDRSPDGHLSRVEFCRLVWAMLIEEDRQDLTMEQLEQLLTVPRINQMADVVTTLRTEAIVAAAPRN